MVNLTALRDALRRHDDASDEVSWPEASMRLLRESGRFGTVIAKAHGGSDAAPLDQLRSYQAIGAGSVTVALILTQHDAACELLGDCDSNAMSADVLTRCAGGEALGTVGISQLTTSRRHGTAALRATPDGDGFVLNGVMPWVTSASKADFVVTGAVLDDGQQVLGCLPTNTPGMTAGEPMNLMSLRASWTSEVRCEQVRLTRDMLMRGPAEKVLALRAPVKPLKVSSVGLGLATALLDDVREMSANLDGADELLRATVVPVYESVRDRIFAVADKLNDPTAEIPSGEIRADVNALIVRLSATLMTLAKGTGYLAHHPTQRLVRESMFFLVWSAPDPVRIASLRRLWV